MKTLLLALAGLALLGCAAPARESAPPPAAAAPASQERSTETMAKGGVIVYADDPEYWGEIICKREAVTGTRMTKARCHSRYDWERMQGAARETMRDIENQPVGCGAGAGCGPGD
jgi:hypothetical protein